jgi:hypothetical protein
LWDGWQRCLLEYFSIDSPVTEVYLMRLFVKRLCLGLAVVSVVCSPVVQGVADQSGVAQAQTPPPSVDAAPAASAAAVNQEPDVIDLGNDRYRIGTIEIDRALGAFVVPGVVLRKEPPLEYVAVTKGGMKGYESLLELEVNAFEFNLACVLIGLNPDNASPSEGHFAEKAVDGDRVAITLSWTVADKTITAAVGDVLLQEGVDARKDAWAYTGSIFDPGGYYLAQEFGPLIGFVHDPVAVIDHVTGLGLGNWGSILVRDDVPPPGSAISVTVKMLQSESL